MTRLGGWSMPGVGALDRTVEREILWGSDNARLVAIYDGALLSSATRDARNTVTTILGAGLVLGRITASGLYKHYDPAATDGSEVARAVLSVEVNILDPSGTASQRLAPASFGGYVKAGQLGGLDTQARQQLQRFVFDDDPQGLLQRTLFPVKEDKTANYTVVAADCGKLFTNKGAAGAVTFTLPTLARGLWHAFYVEADQNVVIAAATGDTMVVFNDPAADSIAFSTASEKVGAMVKVWANSDATKWLTEVSLGTETQTPTIAT